MSTFQVCEKKIPSPKNKSKKKTLKKTVKIFIFHTWVQCCVPRSCLCTQGTWHREKTLSFALSMRLVHAVAWKINFLLIFSCGLEEIELFPHTNIHSELEGSKEDKHLNHQGGFLYVLNFCSWVCFISLTKHHWLGF